MSKQDALFLKSEGDNWFLRNRAALGGSAKIDMDHPLSMLEQHKGLRLNRVLEVGCSNGWRLGEISSRYGSSCVGVEPSEAAILEGKSKFPKVEFLRGLASELPIADEKFDLVIVNFVLHWVGREDLLKAVAEVDRVLAEGGHLLLGDFLPDSPTRRSYHHLPGQDVFTFKQDYAQIFQASNLYTLVNRVTFDHDQPGQLQKITSGARGVTSLLRKSVSEFYVP